MVQRCRLEKVKIPLVLTEEVDDHTKLWSDLTGELGLGDEEEDDNLLLPVEVSHSISQPNLRAIGIELLLVGGSCVFLSLGLSANSFIATTHCCFSSSVSVPITRGAWPFLVMVNAKGKFLDIL